VDQNQINALKKFLSSKRKIVILGHKGPDGDAVGATLALSQFLKKINQSTTVIVPNDFPDFLKWLPESDTILVFDKAIKQATKAIKDAELIFTLDFNTLSRVGEDMQHLLESLNTPFALIDHHQQPGDFATYKYSDVTMSSTAEMVYHFIEMMQGANLIDQSIATCIYTGIMTDTGSFRFSSTSSETHRVAAKLIDLGIDNAMIHQAVFDTNSPERMQLLGVALQNLQILEPFHTAYITLTQDELDRHNFKKGDTEGFVNYALSVKGIVFAAIFIENKQEEIIKISFRSIGDFSVNEFARNHFNGGGHNNAAGGRSSLSLKETISDFITNLQLYKNELSNE